MNNELENYVPAPERLSFWGWVKVGLTGLAIAGGAWLFITLTLLAFGV